MPGFGLIAWSAFWVTLSKLNGFLIIFFSLLGFAMYFVPAVIALVGVHAALVYVKFEKASKSVFLGGHKSLILVPLAIASDCLGVAGYYGIYYALL